MRCYLSDEAFCQHEDKTNPITEIQIIFLIKAFTYFVVILYENFFLFGKETRLRTQYINMTEWITSLRRTIVAGYK